MPEVKKQHVALGCRRPVPRAVLKRVVKHERAADLVAARLAAHAQPGDGRPAGRHSHGHVHAHAQIGRAKVRRDFDARPHAREKGVGEGDAGHAARHGGEWLLSRQRLPPRAGWAQQYDDAGEPLPFPPKRICFVGVENKSAEDIGDFKDELYQVIDTRLLQTPIFQPLNRRVVDAGLLETRLRPDQLCIPEHMRQFATHLEREGEPIDYLLYATLTSGTTRENRDYERSYRLTMELIDVRTGNYDKQSADLVKGYHHSRLSRWRATNPLSR